ncbi:MAG TPA: alpha/beta fold hydrolase [Chthoniobacterales bacterium]|jgi:pimeloyl-ACP methyl ester carboxylesterase|nr:alpha/beta fold hydrolase [Chthoniobacterales bacterium]
MRNPLFARKIIRAVVSVCFLVLAGLTLLYSRQHSMVYHPRPYDESYAYAFPADGVEINYTVAAAKYCAYYIPGSAPLPKRLRLAFCGNGSLALDWTTILREYPYNGDAFLLIDYPGYGKNGGYATIASTRASVDAALRALTERLHTDEDHLTLCTIGHSLSAAVALEFATHHRVQKVVLIAPFTTLREEAATMLGGWVARLLIESYDNRANLAEVARLNPAARIAIFHGTNDGVIPVRMGRELAREFPFVEFFAIEDADHVSVLNHAHDKIIAWMNK